MLLLNSPEYCFSVLGADDSEIQFSSNDLFMAVSSEKSIRIYDVPDNSER